jgi:integrase
VDLLPALVDDLVGMRARSGGTPGALVFGTSTGAKQSPSNVRTRLMARAAEKANVMLEQAGSPPLPESLTPHSLRRTFVSVLLTLDESVPYVMEQAGHTSPVMTLGIYARVMRRSDDEKGRLRALVEGGSLPTVSARFGAERATSGVRVGPTVADVMAETAL